MRRRRFIMGLASIMVSPLAARAQQFARPPRVAVLTLREAGEATPLAAAFRDELRQLGYVEGQTVTFDYRYAEGDVGRLNDLAEDLISSKPDVVLADPSSARAIKAIAPSLPIVCVALSDAFFPEFAVSYARPGGSVTGISLTVEGLMGKLVELTHEIVPKAARIGFLSNPAGASMKVYFQSIHAAARNLGVSIVVEEATTSNDFAAAFERLTKQIQAIIVPPNGLYQSNRAKIMQLALAAHLPTIVAEREFVEVGALASYGDDTKDRYRAAAGYVAKILKGANPGDLPIQFSTKVELVLNLRTAKALDLTIDPSLLARADEVIE
jgi:putative tryptophan/tyrosine transport system substrate-binding protein